MPTTYAHYRFGSEIISKLSKPTQEIISRHRELFDFGVHGPDLLFYYRPVVKNRVNQIGHICHEQTGRTFFTRAMKALKAAGDQEAALAYLLGVLCHFTLDRECHPYVAEKELTGVSHSAIEASFDRRLMEMDGIDPLHHKVTGHLHPSRKSARVICEFYSGASEADIYAAERYMVRCLDFLALPPGSRKTAFLRGLSLVRLEAVGDMFITEAPNLACEDSDELLLRHYGDALELAPILIDELLENLRQGTPLGIGFDHTFGAE